MTQTPTPPKKSSSRASSEVPGAPADSRVSDPRQGSPVTGIIEESQVVIDFGKYEGKTVQQIAALDPEFYQKLVNQRDSGVFAIRRNRDKIFRLYLNPLTRLDQ